MSSVTISSQVPPGTIVAIASNLTGAYAIPASGTVDSLGWMYCDGSAIPAGHTVSGNTPNLTDSRFLMGSSSSGTTGGANSYTLSVAQLPAHTHDSGSYATNTSTTVASNSHIHLSGSYVAAIGKEGNVIRYQALSTTTYSTDRNVTGTSNSGTAGSLSEGADILGASDTPSSNTSLDNIDIDGDSGSTGSGSSIENRPLYFSCQYIIKVS